MKVSVIMVAFNSQNTIGSAVESFLAQEYPDKELIVIDGGSYDDTCDIVRSFDSPLIRLYSEPDRGIYDAMNKGLRKMKGNVFGCLNSDDCYARIDALGLVVKALQDTDLVSGQLNYVRDHENNAPVRVWRPSQYCPGAYALGYSLPHPTTYARRSVYDRVGEFSTLYRCAADYDWLLRALEIEGFSHRVIDEVLVNMRIGGESTAGLRAIFRNSKELLHVRRRWLGSAWLDAALVLNIVEKTRQYLFVKGRPERFNK